MPRPRQLCGSGAYIAIAVTLLFLVAYPLTIGPVAAMTAYRNVPTAAVQTLEFLYWPLTWTAERSKPIAAALRWYVFLWIDFPRVEPDSGAIDTPPDDDPVPPDAPPSTD